MINFKHFRISPKTLINFSSVEVKFFMLSIIFTITIAIGSFSLFYVKADFLQEKDKFYSTFSQDISVVVFNKNSVLDFDKNMLLYKTYLENLNKSQKENWSIDKRKALNVVQKPSKPLSFFVSLHEYNKDKSSYFISMINHSNETCSGEFDATKNLMEIRCHNKTFFGKSHFFKYSILEPKSVSQKDITIPQLKNKMNNNYVIRIEHLLIIRNVWFFFGLGLALGLLSSYILTLAFLTTKQREFLLNSQQAKNNI